MTQQDVDREKTRIDQFDKLTLSQKRFQQLLREITSDWPDTGPSGQGPFTSNTRESRLVETLQIGFSKTLGGAEKVAMKLEGLEIPASEFGAMLEKTIREKLAKIEGALKIL